MRSCLSTKAGIIWRIQWCRLFLLVIITCICIFYVKRASPAHLLIDFSGAASVVVESPSPMNQWSLTSSSYCGDLDLPGVSDCVNADTIIPCRQCLCEVVRHSKLHMPSPPIPFLGTNVDYDVAEWTTRLVNSLDYPIAHKVVAAGGCEKHLMHQMSRIRESHTDITFLRTTHTMGVAAGWNRLLRYMEHNLDIPFGIIVNNDVHTPPGALRNLSEEVWHMYNSDQKLCFAHFEPCCFTSFVVTRRAIRALGHFDENIYPAYWEDSDMYLRLDRAVEEGVCSPMRKLASAVLRHGDHHYYVSGNYVQREKMTSPDSDEETRHHGVQWQQTVERGEMANPDYFKAKWGCPTGFTKDNWRSTCLNRRPFNRSDFPLSWWTLDKERRKCIDGFNRNCTYDVSLLDDCMQ